MTPRRKRGPCGKLDFPTRTAAETELARCQGRRSAGEYKRKEHHVYFCARCLGWHLTSQPTTARHQITDRAMDAWRIAR